MKRSLLKLLGCAAIFVTSLTVLACEQAVPEYDARTDTVITLGTPSVKGTAYPGVNYVYWDNVANAKEGYEYEIYKDGKLCDSSWTNGNSIVDTDLDYNVKKTYKVRAKCSTNARTLYFIEGSFGSVEVTPIIPDYDVKPTNLVLYEKGYDETKKDSYVQTQLTEAQQKYQISSKNIKVTKNDKENKFTVTFPAKAYLTYDLYLEGNGNVYNDLEKIGSYNDLSVTDKMVSISSYVTKAGAYKLSLKLKAYNNKYISSEIISIPETINYEAVELETNETAKNISAKVSTTSVALEWNPVKFADGSVVPAANYIVYRKVVDSNVYEKVNAEIRTKTVGLGSTAKTYCMEDTVNTTKSYVYSFVITKGDKYSSIASSKTVNAYGTNAVAGDTDVTIEYKNAETIVLTWTPDVLADGSCAKTSDYTIYRKVSGTSDDTYVQVSGIADKDELQSYDLDEDAIVPGDDEEPSIDEDPVVNEIGIIKKENTIFGNVSYKFIDKITNNAVAYDYAVLYTDGNVLYKTEKSIDAYLSIAKTGSTNVTSKYLSSNTVRVQWTPDVLSNGENTKTDSYSVYRKLISAPDSEYKLVEGTIEVANTIFGETLYYIDSLVFNNAAEYVYVVMYKDDETLYRSATTVYPYVNDTAVSSQEISPAYVDAETIKVTWIPATLANGSKVATTAYKVYRKVQGAEDSTYKVVDAVVESTVTVFGAKTYSVTETIDDNTIAYVYLVLYEDNGTVYKAIKTLNAYDNPVRNGSTSATVTYADEENINIVWVPETLSNGAKAPKAAYKLYRKVLNAADDSYVLVSAPITEENTIFATTSYVVTDSVADNTQAYVYVIFYTNNGVTYTTEKTVSAYAESLENRASDISAAYIADNKVRVEWTPDTLADGSVATTAAYKVYRKLSTASDSVYEAVSGTVISSVTVFGETKYYIDAGVTNNAADYVYAVLYKDAGKIYRSVKTVYAYKNVVAEAQLNITAAYTSERTAKVSWTPAVLSNGATSSAAAYKVYRKVQGTEDTSYELCAGTVGSEVTVFGEKTYYVADAIEDNNAAYEYLVVYEDKGVTYKTTKVMNAYTVEVRNGNTQISASYASETAVKVQWIPDTRTTGAAVSTGDYKVYRKVQGSADTTYVVLGKTITEEKTIFGAKAYVLTDTVTDSSKAYTYVVVYTDNDVTYKTEKTVSAYSESLENRASDISAVYIADNKVRVEWTPDTLADGSVATTAAYKVYRKLSTASDSAYSLVNDTTVKAETTIFGQTKYYIDSFVINNSVKYDYALVYADAGKLYRSVATVNSYSETYDSLRLDAIIGYIDSTTAGFFWNPTKLGNGSVAKTTDYKVYRKVQGTSDATYEELAAAVEQKSTIFGIVKYGITETITDNTVSYIYLVTLKDNGKTYKYTSTLDAYNSATPSSSSKVIAAGYVADNTVRVIWTPDTYRGATLATSDYKLYRKEYYSTDDTYALVAENVKQSERVNPTTSKTEVVYYVDNAISDDTVIYEYVLMYSLGVTPYYTYTSVSKSVVSASPIAASAGFYTADKDNLNNDAWISLVVSPVNQIDYIKYIISDNANAKYVAADFENELNLEDAFVLTADGTIEYEFTISDVPDGSYVYVATSVDGAYTCIHTTKASTGTPSVKVENVEISTINLVSNEVDGFANDVFFTVKTGNAEQKVTVKIAKAETESEAKNLLKSKYVETIVTDLTGYTYYEFDAETYAALKDLDHGTVIAVSVTVTEANKNTYSATKVSAAVNNGSTTAPKINDYSVVDYNKDGIFNDALFTVTANDTAQTIKVTYAVSKKSTDDALKLLNSSKAINLDTIEDVSSGRTSYSYVIENVKNGTYIAVKAVASEEGKSDSFVTKTAAVSLTGTKAIVSTSYSTPLTQADNIGLIVNQYQLDSEFDTVDYMGIAVLEYQTLDSIEYAYGPTKDIAKAMLDNSAVVRRVDVPSNYDLIFNDADRAVVHHVYRIAYENIRNIPLGNYIAVRANVSQNGFAIEPTVITTDVVTYREAVSKPVLSVNDNNNYEYVKIVITDSFNTNVHAIYNYTYRIERVLESNYRKDATTWETVKTIDNSYSEFEDVYGDGSNYSFVMYQSYPEVKFGERYLYRVVKTRKATGEMNGSDKTVRVSRNTVAPEIAFASVESENIIISSTEVFNTNYDRLDKWNYELKYYIDYSAGTDPYYYPTYYTVQDWEWEEDTYSPGVYRMKNAVISGIENNWNDKAILNVVLVKTRADDYYNQYSVDTGWIDYSTTIQSVLKWNGFRIEFNPDVPVGLTDTTTEYSSFFTFTANTGFDEYVWYLDGVRKYGNSDRFDVYKSNLKNGAHDVLVICKKDGITYSDSITFIK